MLRKFAIVLLAGAALAGAAQAQDVITARKEGYKGLKDAMGAIKKTLESGGPVAEIKPQAERLVAFSQKVGGLFPAGSDKGDTKAKPEIWANMDDFAAKGKAYGEEAARLVQTVDGGDKAAVVRQFAAVGASCKACHEKYRAE